MIRNETVELKWNLEIDLFERGKRKRWHQRTHNIVTNIGRQFMAEVITPSSLGAGSFVRTQDTCVRYIGFGIGGTRQTASAASASPYSDAYPTGYPGTNLQTDTDVTVAGLERPVRVNATPLWMQEIAVPGTFPAATSTRFVATFAETDISYGAFTSVPISEIALYKSSADPAEFNGQAGTYPGAGTHAIAYDTFNSFAKSSSFTIQARWEFRFA